MHPIFSAKTTIAGPHNKERGVYLKALVTPNWALNFRIRFPEQRPLVLNLTCSFEQVESSNHYIYEVAQAK